MLQRYGYYSIINGYKDPYRIDKEIRNALMAAMLDIENNLRNALAHTLGESFTANQVQYLDKKNFRSGRSRNGVYQIDELLHKFHKIAQDDVQPMKHYRETYGNIPPWILLKGASFGNLVNFIKLQKGPQKDRIISLVYDMPFDLVREIPALKDLFMDTLFVCLDYRNRAAHGGRIYNFETKSKFRFSPLLHERMLVSEADYRNGKGHTGIKALLCAIQFMDNKNPSFELSLVADYYAREHCKLYPKDIEYLKDFFEFKM